MLSIAVVDTRLTVVVSPLLSLIQDQMLACERLNIVAAAYTSESTTSEPICLKTLPIVKVFKFYL